MNNETPWEVVPWNNSEADPIEDLKNAWDILSATEYIPESEIWGPRR